MNIQKSISNKYLSLPEAQAWSDAKVKSGKWVNGKVVECKEQTSVSEFITIFMAYVYNPAPTLCPYTQKPIGNNTFVGR